uniref:Uncharacterized protein n=1 Tax=Bionectria ochroleuca TaxID=29856 RepID=A0A0B7KNX6_BIOOC
MDVLLSIPLVSTIFTPSWSTSINILFFYATWSTLVLTHDAAVIHATTLFGTLANSGYSIVPGIFLGGIARRTAVHYASKGKANYGAWGFLDWVNGTSRGGDVLEDVKDEAEKHRLKERSSKKVDEGAGLIQDGIDALTNGTGTRRSTRKRTPRKTG